MLIGIDARLHSIEASLLHDSGQCAMDAWRPRRQRQRASGKDPSGNARPRRMIMRYGPWRTLAMGEQFQVPWRRYLTLRQQRRRLEQTASMWGSLLKGRKFIVYELRGRLIVRRVA